MYTGWLCLFLAPINGHNMGNRPMVDRLLRGVFNLKPPIMTFFPTRFVGKVVKILRLLGPNMKLDLGTLTYQTLVTARNMSSLVLFSL